MARIRSIKPEIRSSEKVTSWPIEVRYAWILLWGFCDDHGRARDNARLFRADAYPLDDQITLEDVEGYLTQLATAGVIERYEVDGTRYLRVVNWTEHQKPQHPSKSVIPCPHGVVVQGQCDAHETLPNSSGSPHEGFVKPSSNVLPQAGSGKQGSGSGEASDDAPPASTCTKHPEGTDRPCMPCKTARLAREEWDRAHAVPSVPRPTMPDECPRHPGFPPDSHGPLGCDRCRAEREEQAA